MEEKIIENPITSLIVDALERASNESLIAVPFISSYSAKIFTPNSLKKIASKKLLTRFDETNINSFHLPALEHLLKEGFEIRYDNNIHLKLYVFDSKAFITSSNLTQSGFETNTELTIQVADANVKKCIEVFNKSWDKAISNEITQDIINANMPKYLLLKKRADYRAKAKIQIKQNFKNVGSLDIDKLVDEIFWSKSDYSGTLDKSYQANQLRNRRKMQLKKGFNPLIFYAPENHPLRKDNIFYDFVYGYESGLAGTGLYEEQFKTFFNDMRLKNVVSYVYPEMVSLKSWNLDDEDIYREFCTGIFDFNIPQYSEVLPIRLASYFHPDHFLPIFKIEHLENVCAALGLETDAQTSGEKLFIYNIFLRNKMQSIPYNNYIKSRLAYQLLYAVELHNKLQAGQEYEAVKKSYKKIWKRDYIEKGKNILMKLGVLK